MRLILLAILVLDLCIIPHDPAFAQKQLRERIQQPPAPSQIAEEKATAPSRKTITQTQATNDPLLLIQQFTLTDLQAALADAQAQAPPDTTAASCYQALITIVQSQSAQPGGLPSGLFSGFQKARDTAALLANLQSPNGPLSSLNVACAPLILSTQNTLIQLGILVGLVAPKIPIP